MELGASLDTIEAQWEALKQSDASRQELFERIYRELQAVTTENERLREKIESFEYHEKNYQRDLRDRTNECKTMQDRISLFPFVLVLIDGDSTLFNDEYVRAGSEGGHRAASELKSKLLEYIKELGDYQSDWEIMVRLYVKMEWLIKTYVAGQIVNDANTVRAFFRGFNEVFAMFEAIDAGNDKEGADAKVKQNVRLFVNNQHCKHVVLAGSSDASYVGSLRQYAMDPVVAKRISLVEAIPFPAKYHEIRPHLESTRFPDIFRSRKIEGNEAACQPTISPRVNYATAAQNPIPGIGQVNLHDPPSETHSEFKIKWNREGQRIDDKLPKSRPDLVDKFKALKLCNRHYLTKCLRSDKCEFNHTYPPLSAEEKLALRRVARMSRCGWGLHCNDRHCVATHHCPYGERCQHGDQCSLPHIGDITVASIS